MCQVWKQFVELLSLRYRNWYKEQFLFLYRCERALPPDSYLFHVESLWHPCSSMILGDFCADGLYVTHKQMSARRIHSDNFHWLIGDDNQRAHQRPVLWFSVSTFLSQNCRVWRRYADGCRAKVGQTVWFSQGVLHDWRNSEIPDTAGRVG